MKNKNIIVYEEFELVNDSSNKDRYDLYRTIMTPDKEEVGGRVVELKTKHETKVVVGYSYHFEGAMKMIARIRAAEKKETQTPEEYIAAFTEAADNMKKVFDAFPRKE